MKPEACSVERVLPSTQQNLLLTVIGNFGEDAQAPALLNSPQNKLNLVIMEVNKMQEN